VLKDGVSDGLLWNVLYPHELLGYKRQKDDFTFCDISY
jgi:hypothetical protein